MTETGPPDLAVVIVNYESGAWLARCLDSLAAHRGDLAVETVVIDNASTDGSADAAEGRAGVRLIRNPANVYLSPAWNEGARRTTAPWLLFLNPDTEWWRGTLADLVAEAAAVPDAGIVGPKVRNVDGSVYASGRTFPDVGDALGHAFASPFTRDNRFTRRLEMDGWDRTTARDVDWVSGCCMLMPRAAYDAVEGFDEAFPLFGEELDTAARLRERGWRVRFTPAVEIIHEVGVSAGGTRRRRESIVMQSASMYRYYAKHRAAGWRRLTLPFAWMTLRARAELAWAVERVRAR
ncbi:MAG TPA: glycosyltransferase family 2 protein [Actinomycetota bacterium]|nr:glycosyltransferase family 2 protein [Actinomycetota bacterium]